jgi:hypothetical protein
VLDIKTIRILEQADRKPMKTRMTALMFCLITLLSAPLAGPLAAQTVAQSEDRRSQMERDLKKRQTMLSQQEAKVREAETNVMQARQAYDQVIAKTAAASAAGKSTSPAASGSSSGTRPSGGSNDPGSQAYKALDAANYKLNVLRADERNLRESVKVLREALAR